MKTQSVKCVVVGERECFYVYIYIGDNKLTRLAFSFVSLFFLSLCVCIYVYIYYIFWTATMES